MTEQELKQIEAKYLLEQACLYDAEFIAHAREDVPKLIAEIRRLQHTIDHGEYEYLKGYINGARCVVMVPNGEVK